MSDSSLRNLLAAYNMFEKQWHEATQADSICGDDLFAIWLDMELLKAAIEREQQ
jgi:hypothetical protein